MATRARPLPSRSAGTAAPSLNPAARRVGDMLGRPLVTCTIGTSVQEAARQMAARDTDSIVVLGPAGDARGIITDSDLRRRVVGSGLSPDAAVDRVMSAPLVTIDADSFFFEAMHAMLRHRLHHLVVVRAGQPCGVLADRDLLSTLTRGPLFVARQLDQARSLEQLVELTPARQRAMRLLFRSGASPYDLARITAETNDHLVRRVLTLVEDELGPPPLAYCWLGLGSGGRREQTLKTDQDNALVYRDPPPDLAAVAERYFAELAARVVAQLERCGFPLCHGELMASNPTWCQPLGVWRGYFARWVRRPEPEALYNAELFFDLRSIGGDSTLASALWADLVEWIPESPLFARLLMRAALCHRPPLGLFRNFVVEQSGAHRGGFHVKARGLMPVVEAARAYALARGITHTNTVERLRALRDAGAINARDADDLIAAYQFIMGLRIRQHLEQLAGDVPLDDFIVPAHLSRVERKTLKEHFRVIGELQSFIQSRVMLGGGG